MRFICDAMLGRLAKYLRMLGLDAPYVRNPQAIKEYARGGQPPSFLLTRRTGKIDHPQVHIVTSEVITEQLREVKPLLIPFLEPRRFMKRCIECNTELTAVDRPTIETRVPEFIYHSHSSFMQCPACGKVYWEGSHAASMERRLKEVFGEVHGAAE